MEMILVLALVIGVIVLMSRSSQRGAERKRELQNAQDLEKVLKVADEDTTRFGEELQELDLETMTTSLDPAMRQDYQRALDSYESAKTLLRDAQRPDDVEQATKTLEDGRYAMACVQARASGEALPQRRPPCFFNPAHGPAQTDVKWSPAGGDEREIPVCLADADRLAHGAEPDSRQVRDGNRMVPWYQGGPAYAPYAGGYYGGYAMNGLFPAFILGSMMGGMGGWGGDAGGGDMGGGDMGGGDMGGDMGGGDVGGGDMGGGGDGGGFLDGFGDLF